MRRVGPAIDNDAWEFAKASWIITDGENSEGGEDFSESAQDFLDFTRCQRPDGSYYGTSGQCRKGKPVGPRERALLKKAAEGGNKKAEVALAVVEGKMTKSEAKKEIGYKPKGKVKESRNVLQRAKDKLTGKNKKGTIDEVGFESKDQIKSMMNQRRSQLEVIENPIRKKQALARVDQQEKAALKAHDNNKKFAADLKKELPSNVKTSIDDMNGGIVMKAKVGKDTVEATFSPTTGWNYQVNGGYDAGTVTDRAQQIKVASQVRQMYDATVRAAPEGQVFNTSAYDEDGRGGSRKKAYQRLGFSKPDDNETMYAVKRNGRMVPAEASDEKDSPLLFTEDDQDQIWLEIVFGGKEDEKT